MKWSPGTSANSAEGRNILSRALEADLGKLADSRAEIDGLVAGQVEKIAEGRAVLAKALETDIVGIKDLIETIRRSSPRTAASWPCARARSVPASAA